MERQESKNSVFGAFVFALLASALLIGALAGCGADPTPTSAVAPTATTDTPTAQELFDQEWAALIEAAKAEGILNVTQANPTRAYDPVLEFFGEKFDIEVRVSRGRSSAVRDRILAELAAGKYTEDVAMVGGRSGAAFIAVDGFIPFEPLLIHPEVLDKSLWYGGRYWWADVGQKYLFNHRATLSQALTIAYNTESVNLDEFTSFVSILDDQWRVTVTPPTETSGQTNWVQAWHNPDLGPDFVRALIVKADFSSDTRSQVDGLGAGKFDFCVLSNSCNTSVNELNDTGVPLNAKTLPLDKPMQERGSLRGTGSGNVVGVWANAPHPNAAKLFANWMLTREGQTAFHTLEERPPGDGPAPTLRDDVTDWGTTLPIERREVGKTYIFPSSDPEFVKQLPETLQMIQDLYQERLGG